VTWEDFLHAIFICSQPADQAERALMRWWLPWFFRLWGWCNRRADVVAELRRFRRWYDEQTRMPGFHTPAGRQAGRELGAPGAWLRLLFLHRECGCTAEAARRTPVLEANALFATWADLEGRAELFGPDWEDFVAFARERDRQVFNEDGTRKAEAG
jgi:hypothetical protein